MTKTIPDGLVERLRALVDTQINDDLEYIRQADALMTEAADALSTALKQGEAEGVRKARPESEWHEDYADVVWWTWENGAWIGEPAWIGTPNDSDWPGYHTHWTPHPKFPPLLPDEEKPGSGEASER